jgi:hypothetical protein
MQSETSVDGKNQKSFCSNYIKSEKFISVIDKTSNLKSVTVNLNGCNRGILYNKLLLQTHSQQCLVLANFNHFITL